MTTYDLGRRSTSSTTLTHSVMSTESATVLVLAGELDFAVSAQLERVLNDLVGSSRAPVVVVDASEVAVLDATCIGVIVAAHAAAAARDRRLYVSGLRTLPDCMLTVLGLDWLRLPRAGGARPLGE